MKLPNVQLRKCLVNIMQYKLWDTVSIRFRPGKRWRVKGEVTYLYSSWVQQRRGGRRKGGALRCSRTGSALGESRQVLGSSVGPGGARREPPAPSHHWGQRSHLQARQSRGHNIPLFDNMIMTSSHNDTRDISEGRWIKALSFPISCHVGCTLPPSPTLGD